MPPGRPRKPTQLKVITGNPGKRALNRNEPDPNYLQDLTAPEWLSPAAKNIWNEVAPDLRESKLLTVLDVYALASLCVSLSQYRFVVMKVGDQLVRSKLVEDDDGNLVETGEHISPWLMCQSMAFKQMNQMFQQFGMTPAARSRLAINPQGDLFANDNDNKEKGYFG